MTDGLSSSEAEQDTYAWGDSAADAGDSVAEDQHAYASAYDEAPPVKLKPSPVRLAIQGVLAVVGIGLFIWLVFRLADGLSGGLSIALVVLLFIILVVEILLVETIYRRITGRPDPLPIPDGPGDTFVIGCPGCGTVFTLGEAEVEAGKFACTNCGRKGYVADRNLNTQQIAEERCTTCGHTYLEYMEHSECPKCHTFNEY